MWPYDISTVYRSLLFIFQNIQANSSSSSSSFTGANSFGFYAVNIFRQTFAGMNPHVCATAAAFVQLLASMLSGLLIDTVGRIPLLIVSSVFMSLALASFGSYVYYDTVATKLLATTNAYDVSAASSSANMDWIPLLCVLLFTVAFSLGTWATERGTNQFRENLNAKLLQEFHRSLRYWSLNYFHSNTVALAVRLQPVSVTSVHF